MRWIDVARHGGEQVDVLRAERTYQLCKVTDLYLVEDAVLDERLSGVFHI